jgi:penicillin-binding protein 2
MLHHHQYSGFEEGYSTWFKLMKQFGLGEKMGIDIPYEASGNLPSAEYYNRIYGKGRWKGMTVVSNSIGQGEILMTPVQMANMAAIFANRGSYITPHFFKAVYNEPEAPRPQFHKEVIDVDTAVMNLIVEGMFQVVEAGTGYFSRIPNITMCAKTGTAQNPHGEDHSVFVAFAPKEDPKIAIAVVVENAGFGGVWAGPISSLMIEKYLTDSIAAGNRRWHEQRILEKRFIVDPTQVRDTSKKEAGATQQAFHTIQWNDEELFAELLRTAEAEAEAEGHDKSFLRLTRPYFYASNKH